MPGRVIGIADGTGGFVNIPNFAAHAPGDAVDAVVTCNAGLCIVDQIPYRILPVIGGIGLVGNIAGIKDIGYRIANVLQPVMVWYKLSIWWL